MPTPLASDYLFPGPVFVLAILVGFVVLVAVVVLVVLLVVNANRRDRR